VLLARDLISTNGRTRPTIGHAAASVARQRLPDGRLPFVAQEAEGSRDVVGREGDAPVRPLGARPVVAPDPSCPSVPRLSLERPRRDHRGDVDLVLLEKRYPRRFLPRV
jgi:hypothetical protein